MSKNIKKVSVLTTNRNDESIEDEYMKVARERVIQYYKETKQSSSEGEYLKPVKIRFDLSKSESSTLSDFAENRRKILACSKSTHKRKYDGSGAESDPNENLSKVIKGKHKYNSSDAESNSEEKRSKVTKYKYGCSSTESESKGNRQKVIKRKSKGKRRKVTKNKYDSSDTESDSEEKLRKSIAKKRRKRDKARVAEEKRKTINPDDVNGFTHKKKLTNFREMLNRVDQDDRPKTILKYGHTIRVCDDCLVSFKDKDAYEDHIKRTTDCTQGVHGNTKSQKDKPKMTYVCEICNPDYTFSGKRERERHDKSKKHAKNVAMNGGTINIVDKSTHIYVDNRTIIHNYSVYPFFRYDITDLTMYQQLGVLTDIGSLIDIGEKSSPYVTLLSLLNLNKEMKKYHNIYCTDPQKKKIKIFNGITDTPVSHELIHTKQIAEGQRTIICEIYNRFRFFLSRRSSVFSSKYLFDGLPESETYPQNNKMIKRYICDHTIDKSVLPNENTPAGEYLISKSLSKHFTWRMTVIYITAMEQIGINFSHNINKIARCIKKYVNANEECASFFVPLFIRFEHLRKKMVQAAFGYAVNNSDTSGNEMMEPVYMGPSAGNGVPFKKVALDDHSSYVSQNTFYGSKASGIPFYDICLKLDSKAATDPKYLADISKLIPANADK